MDRVKSAAIKDNITGVIYVGHNHAAIANDSDTPKYVVKGLPRNLCFGRLGTQGFVLYGGRFVGRHEAADIALACGQIKRIQYSYGLDSADINYPEEQ
jgi:hypothetical protein